MKTLRICCLVLIFIAVSSFKSKALTSLSPSKYSIDVDFTITGQSMGFLFGATTTGNLYMWQLNCQTANHFKIRPHIRKNGSWVFNTDVDVSTVISEASKHSTHHLKIAVNADTIKSYLNGVWVDTRIDKIYLKGQYGRVGLRASPVASDNESGTIDNLEIKDGDGKMLYTNNFDVSATDFPDCQIVDGALKLKSGSEFALKNGMWTAKYSIETEFTAQNFGAGLMFSAIDNDNLYMWQYNTEQAHARLRPHKRINGSWSSIKDVDLSSIIPDNQKNAKHRMKIDVQGTSLVTYMDGIKADSLVLEEFGFGNFGFRFDGEDALFNNLFLKDQSGKTIYANDFSHNPPINFPSCISVNGQLTKGSETTEFQLYTPGTLTLTGDILTPKTQIGQLGDTISVNLTSLTDETIRSLPIHYQINGGEVFDGIVDSVPGYSSVTYTFPQKHTFNRHFPEVDTVTVWTYYETMTSYVASYLSGSDYALNFTGKDTKNVMLNNITGLSPDRFTVEAWVYPIASGTKVYEGTILCNQNDAFSGYALKVGNADREIRFEVGTSAGWETAVGGFNSLVMNQWQHIAGVFTGDSVQIFVNGLLKGSKKVSGTLQKSTKPLIIGANPTWPDCEFSGMIDELSIWNLALTNKQISSTTSICLDGKEPGLIAYYRFNEGPGATSINDVTSYNHTGNMVNFLERERIWGLGKKLPVRALLIPEALNIASTEGSIVSFKIQSNTHWNIYDLPEWLTVNPSKGSVDSVLITFTALKNHLTTTRSDSLKVSDGFIEKTLIVTQDRAATFISVPSIIGLDQFQNSVRQFALSSNTTWEISDIASWINIDKIRGTGVDTLLVMANSDNNLAGIRVDTIWISHDNLKQAIFIAQLGSTPGLILSSIDKIAPIASKKTISLNANRNWEIKSISDPSWFIVGPQSGTSSSEIYLDVTANKSGMSRKDTILFTCGEILQKIVVTQDSAVLQIPASLLIHSSEASYQDFDLTSNIDWVIRIPESDSWLSVNVPNQIGHGERKVRLTASQNPYDVARVGRLFVSSLDLGIMDSLTITQDASAPYLIVDSAVIHLGAASKLTNNFEVQTNSKYWTATTKEPTWFTISRPASSSNPGKVLLTASENKSFSSRADTLFIHGSILDTIVVKQDAAIPTLRVLSFSPAYLDANEDSKVTFTISSNVSWSVKGLKSWLMVDKTEGTGSATVTLTAQRNALFTTRKDTMTISGTDGVNQQTIVVLQARAEVTEVVSESVLRADDLFFVYPNPTKGLFNIVLGDSQTLADLQIYNATGVLIKNVKIQQQSLVDLTALPNGLYLLKVCSGKVTKNQKLMKQ